MWNLTDEEIEAEWKYKVDERLGIMCQSQFCTPAQRRLAIEHADWWKYAALGFRSAVRSDDVHLPDAGVAPT
jgi:hypothetical protein